MYMYLLLVYVYMYIYTHVYVYMHMYMSMYACEYLCMYARPYFRFLNVETPNCQTPTIICYSSHFTHVFPAGIETGMPFKQLDKKTDNNGLETALDQQQPKLALLTVPWPLELHACFVSKAALENVGDQEDARVFKRSM